MHDGTIAQGNTWLARNLPAILNSPQYRAGTTSKTFFSHYSLLATTEQLLGLPRLGQAASSPTMTAAFHL